MGVDVRPTADGIVIVGKGGSTEAVFNGGRVDSHGDHRIAMSFTIAALRSGGEIRVSDCENVATSFPSFVELAQKAGIRVVAAEG